MKDKIIYASIASLHNEGLKFSVDTVAERLRISKKTIYKYFPTKELLALAIYEKYYLDAHRKAEELIAQQGGDSYRDLLRLYYESKKMVGGEIFNKFKLNEVIYTYALSQSNSLWATICADFPNNASEEDKKALQVIVDGAFEKLGDTQLNADDIIEKLMKLL